MATNQDAAFGLRPIGKVGQNRDAQGLSEYQLLQAHLQRFTKTIP